MASIGPQGHHDHPTRDPRALASRRHPPVLSPRPFCPACIISMRGYDKREASMTDRTILLGIGVPACILFSGSVILFSRGKTVCSFLQLLGAGCLMMVILAHVAEAFQLFPW